MRSLAKAFLSALFLLPWHGIAHDAHHRHHHHHLATDRHLESGATNIHRCGTPSPNPVSAKQFSQLVRDYTSLEESRRRLKKDFMAVVPVVYHIIQADNETQFISLEDIKKQHDALAAAFEGTGFLFTLDGTTRSVNSSWYFADFPSDHDTAMREALHVGGLETLNVYLTNGAGSLGIATLPDIVFLDNIEHDGIIIDEKTVPGVYEWEFNLGLTLVHEVGHWLNLYHTFEGGCESDYGDFCDDTAYEAIDVSGCPEPGSINSCPGRPGFDNVNNYMNYADDACLTEFTPQQVSRMQTAWIVFRESDSSRKRASESLSRSKGKSRSNDKSRRKRKGSRKASYCERRCRLFVPNPYGSVEECTMDQCRGGESCEYPVSIGRPSPKKPIHVSGTTKSGILSNEQDLVFPLSCNDDTIDTVRVWYEVEGDGSILNISSISSEFYPLLAAFTDGCDLTCVKSEKSQTDWGGIRGGTELYLSTENGEKYLVAVHGLYGGNFDLIVESGVEVDSDCFEISPIPGCSNTTCQTAVCEEDSFCCSDSWDGFCALTACENCNNSLPSCEAWNDTRNVTVTISTDFFGGETTWEITDLIHFQDFVFLEGGPFPSEVATYTVTEELFLSCFLFTLRDSANDGGSTATIEFLGETYTVGGEPYSWESVATVQFGQCP